jgi:hypothetical protein
LPKMLAQRSFKRNVQRAGQRKPMSRVLRTKAGSIHMQEHPSTAYSATRRDTYPGGKTARRRDRASNRVSSWRKTSKAAPSRRRGCDRRPTRNQPTVTRPTANTAQTTKGQNGEEKEHDHAQNYASKPKQKPRST